MSELTPNDVRRWDSAAVRNVFQVADAAIPAVRPDMPAWQWELENINPFEGDPFVANTIQLADPISGGIPAVTTGR